MAYLALHRVLYGGWTVYAAGDHFVGGELIVVGIVPDYGRPHAAGWSACSSTATSGSPRGRPVVPGRVPALAALARPPPAGLGRARRCPLAAGWANATWVALTMHGWWWPGRQVVVVAAAASSWPWRGGRRRSGRGRWGPSSPWAWPGWPCGVGCSGSWPPTGGGSSSTSTAGPTRSSGRGGARCPTTATAVRATWILQAVWLGLLALVGAWAWRTAPVDERPPVP